MLIRLMRHVMTKYINIHLTDACDTFYISVDNKINIILFQYNNVSKCIISSKDKIAVTYRHLCLKTKNILADLFSH